MTKTSIDVEYDELVKNHSCEINGENVVFIDRGNGKKRLLIGLATLMNQGIYAGVKSYLSNFSGDVLALVDPANTYYFREDRGVHVRQLIKEVIKDYKPEDVVFCGASMAGFAAIDLALYFNSNAVVNNPQINLERTYEHAWPKLKEVIDSISQRYNIDDIKFKSRHSVIGAIFGQHPMDIANRDALFRMCGDIKGIGLIFGNSFDFEHKYYYQGIKGFLKMVEMVYSHRELMAGIHAKFPE